MSYWPYALGALGAIITGVVSYLVAVRQTRSAEIVALRQASGNINTTEAAQLWEESQAMRKELRDEVHVLQEEVRLLRKTVSDQTIEIVELRAEIAYLRKEMGSEEAPS